MDKKLLKTDLEMLRTVNDFNKRDEPIWFTKLSEMEGWDRRTVSVNTDKLMDLDLMWLEDRLVDDKWTKCFIVTESGKDVLDYLNRKFNEQAYAIVEGKPGTGMSHQAVERAMKP